MWIQHPSIIHYCVHQRFVLLDFQQSQGKPFIAPAPRTIRPSCGSHSKASLPSRTTSYTNGLSYQPKYPVHCSTSLDPVNDREFNLSAQKNSCKHNQPGNENSVHSVPTGKKRKPTQA